MLTDEELLQQIRRNLEDCGQATQTQPACIEEENVQFEDDQASNSKMLCINMVDHEKAMIYLHFVVWISIQCCLVGRDRFEQNDHIYQTILPVFLISYTQWMNL